MKGLVIAGVTSGVGKTTVAVAIMRALTQRGYKVQPFKVGPDYIDPSYHSTACGVPCRNLDSWLLEPNTLKELFHKAMEDKDVAVIEGVMGLFDGATGENEAGSTAELAKLLGLPVVLTIDASKASRSVGAIGLGFRLFDRDLKLAGVILNGIAGKMHLDLARPSLGQSGLRYFGYLPGSAEFRLPERHLGLVPTAEGRLTDSYCDKLAAQASASLELDEILALAHEADTATPDPPLLFPPEPQPRTAAIAVAMDSAFNFYYPDSLDLLEAWGAEIIAFSPLRDPVLPEQATGMYLGGGFPELFAEELSQNTSMHESIRDAAKRGMPMYAECGGLMYLGEGIENTESQHYPMVGVLPCRSVMRDMRLTLGYRTVRATRDTPLMSIGEEVRGHEFHFSSLEAGATEPPPAYEVLDQPGRHEGYVQGNVLASYVHLHFGSRRTLAPRFVSACSTFPRA